MLSTSHALTFLILYHILPTFSCPWSCFSYFLFFFFLSLFVLWTMYSSNMRSPKKTLKPDSVFTDKTGPGLANFTKTIVMAKYSFMLPSANKILGNAVCQGFRTILLWTLTHQFSEAINQPIKKGPTQPPKNYFYSVLLFAPLHQNSTSRNHIQPRWKNGPFFRHPTCMLRNTITRTHIISETAEHSWNSPQTSQIPIFAVRNWRG